MYVFLISKNYLNFFATFGKDMITFLKTFFSSKGPPF
jgi:hypothetical protein